MVQIFKVNITCVLLDWIVFYAISAIFQPYDVKFQKGVVNVSTVALENIFFRFAFSLLSPLHFNDFESSSFVSSSVEVA